MKKEIYLNFSDDLLLSVVLLGDLNVVSVGYWLSFHRVDGRTTIVVDSNLWSGSEDNTHKILLYCNDTVHENGLKRMQKICILFKGMTQIKKDMEKSLKSNCLTLTLKKNQNYINFTHKNKSYMPL